MKRSEFHTHSRCKNAERSSLSITGGEEGRKNQGSCFHLVSGGLTRKLAILGGTLNPVHNGHLYLVQGFRERLGLDRILLIPSRVPPHKAAADLAGTKDRLKMCRPTTQPYGLKVSNLELLREDPSYTVNTPWQLRQTNLDAELYLLVGVDISLTLEHRYQSEELFHLARICAVPRNENGRSESLTYVGHLENLGVKTYVRELSLLPISSTLVRERIGQGLLITGLTPRAVGEYITEYHLYEGISNGWGTI